MNWICVPEVAELFYPIKTLIIYRSCGEISCLLWEWHWLYYADLCWLHWRGAKFAQLYPQWLWSDFLQSFWGCRCYLSRYNYIMTLMHAEHSITIVAWNRLQLVFSLSEDFECSLAKCQYHWAHCTKKGMCTFTWDSTFYYIVCTLFWHGILSASCQIWHSCT